MKKLLLRFRFIIYGAVVGSILTKVMQFLISKDNSLLFLSLYAAIAIATVPIVIQFDKKFINNR
ncbi:hypothetical protein [Lysinibacillus sp. BPa_S21]|uniref:hypothetical protein n=1 Tax=Lysinibacillus sp. BPa_S21 TaxID=2932478 RepID=UPI002010E88D|nr:hypothetical protein [Lysinibacillus sp. BPa_S21]MCL1696319.1 hypothetical protein [Lysinibacillus sp. BPa_S21]